MSVLTYLEHLRVWSSASRPLRLVSGKLTKPQNRRSVLNFQILSWGDFFFFLTFGYWLSYVANLHRSPGELKQMLKVVLPHDAGSLGRTKEPYGFNVGEKDKGEADFPSHRNPFFEKRHSSHPLFAETKQRGLPVWGKWLFLKPIIDWVNGEELLWWAESKECFP